MEEVRNPEVAMGRGGGRGDGTRNSIYLMHEIGDEKKARDKSFLVHIQGLTYKTKLCQ